MYGPSDFTELRALEGPHTAISGRAVGATQISGQKPGRIDSTAESLTNVDAVPC